MNIANMLRRIQSDDMFVTLLRGTSIAFFIQGVGSGFKYFSQIMLARWMGASEFGIYAYAFAWAQILAVLAGLGLTIGVVRFIPEYLAHERWGHLRGIIRRSRQLTVGAGVVVALSGSLLVTILQPRNTNVPAFVIGLWIVPLLASSRLQTEVIRSTQHMFLAYMPPQLLQPVLLLIAAFFLQANGILTGNVTLLMVLLMLSATLIVQNLSIRPSFPDITFRLRAEYETAEWLRVSFPLLLITGSAIILNRTGILLVGLLMGAEQAGIYAVAVTTTMLVGVVLTAVNASAAPMIASLHARQDYENLQRVVSKISGWLLIVALGSTLILLLFGAPILGFFGLEFQAGYRAMAILAIGQAINVSAGPVGYLMNLTGHQAHSARVYGFSAAGNVVLSVLLIPLLGLAGAALATMLTTALWNIWLSILVKKRLGIRSFVFLFELSLPNKY